MRCLVLTPAMTRETPVRLRWGSGFLTRPGPEAPVLSYVCWVTMSAERHPDRAAVQRRTLQTLFTSQMLGGVGVASGLAVGSLLAEEVGGSTSLAGFASTATVLGAALVAVPLSRLMARSGRRPGLVIGYALGVAGSVVTVIAASVGSYPLLLLGLAGFGGGTAANMQARYAATDLAEPSRRGRSLSLVVWATTLGIVLGPNLIEPGGQLAESLDLPPLAGPFGFAAAAFGIALVVLLVRLRPDPLRFGRAVVTSGAPPRFPLVTSLRTIAAAPKAVLGLAAVAIAHTVMVAVMVMTPVHMHHGGATLRVIGLVLSGHLAGMYALSPVMGWLADRFGRIAVVVLGGALLGAALLLAGTAPAGQSAGLAIGLVLLGVGWSGCLVAGSTLLTESVETDWRPAVQGAADLVMGLCGAIGGALGGVVVGTTGFGWLAVGAAPLLLALVALAGLTAGAAQRVAGNA
jgi:MFS family permease